VTEFELKFALDPGEIAAMRRAAPLAGIRRVRRRLLNLYFDSPRAELARAQMALRLRRASGHWFQTLKAGASGTGGVHSRSEWEYPRPGPHLDLSLFADTPLLALKDAEHLHERLAAVFTVIFERETWIVEGAAGSRIEVALDCGEASVAGRREAICEVELEVLQGDAGAAFELAHALLDHVALRPASVTKAARGWRLARDERVVPVKARRAALEETWSPGQAARATLAEGLAHMQANEEGVLASADPEFIHQMRVALRRIRSALGVFRSVLGPGFEACSDELRWIAAVLGTARDWDVLATTMLPQMLAAHGDVHLARRVRALVAARRRKARAAVHAAIRSPRHARLVLGLARALSQPAPVQANDGPVAAFASHVLRKRQKKFLLHSEGLARFTAAERHALRIAAKRLRYGVEGFAPLFGARRVAAYLETLSNIQDDLGLANDAATGARLLAELDLPEAFREYARGWLAAFTGACTAGLEVHIARLAKAKRFWNKAPLAQV
jgi:triphosphatase